MININSIAIDNNIISKYQIKEIIFVLAFSILLQVLIHLIPSGSTPLGAVLLPLFYAPFIAALFYRVHVGLTVAVLSPICNYLITGNPVIGLIGIVTLELVIFVLLTKLLNSQNIFIYVNAPASFLLTKVFSSLAILIFPWIYPTGNFLDYYSSSVQKGIAGILVLFAVNYLTVKLYQKIRK